jgi:hypothetical protein
MNVKFCLIVLNIIIYLYLVESIHLNQDLPSKFEFSTKDEKVHRHSRRLKPSNPKFSRPINSLTHESTILAAKSPEVKTMPVIEVLPAYYSIFPVKVRYEGVFHVLILIVYMIYSLRNYQSSSPYR